MIILIVAVVVILVAGVVVLSLRARENVIIDSDEPLREQQSRAALEKVDTEEVLRLKAAGNLIEAIKLVRGQTGLGLKEAKEYVEGLSSARRARLPPGPLDVESPELEAEVRGLLERGQVIEAIKLVRECTGLGLKEAKEHVDRLQFR